MQLFNSIVEKARANLQTIVLAEGEDPRIIEAAGQATTDKIADCILVGNTQKIESEATRLNIDLSAIRIEDPEDSTLGTSLSDALFERRKHKGMSPEQARQQVLDPLTFADLLLHCGEADGSIAGALYTTGDRVRSALQIIGVAPGFNSVSSFFLMLFDENSPWQGSPAMIFSDCALIIEPDAEQLAEIATAAASSGKQLLSEEPRIAMLSFSTDGSASHPVVEKVQEATVIVRKNLPELAIDGEVQLDAAIVPSVASQKIADSKVNGRANVLIFPGLEAANIGYKLTQRFGGATAIGPILQGLKRPANDLSRGCSTKDVYYLIALTAVQSQG
ncbi:MAG: phosphate acetyltransferase [Pseudomonadota bacterium]